jgi:hypothetical protein
MNTQYVLKTYNKNHEQTFENKFYITVNENNTYIDLLNQMITELKKYNLEFDVSDMMLLLAGNKNSRETYVVLEKAERM